MFFPKREETRGPRRVSHAQREGRGAGGAASGAAGSYDIIEGLARLVNGETNKTAFARCNSSLLNKSFPIGKDRKLMLLVTVCSGKF